MSLSLSFFFDFRMPGEKTKECALHKIRETPLEELDLDNEYEVCRSLAEGCFAKVL